LPSLAPKDFALIQPGLVRVELPLRKQLEGRNKKIEHVYFLESGVAAVSAAAGSTQNTAVGVIGKEGMTGLSLILQTNLSANETVMQIAGAGWRLPASGLRAAISASHTLHARFLQYVHAMMVQIGGTALANARFTVGTRLARCLLMAQDRIEGAEIQLTHELLALMLGTRRPGVTNALTQMEEKRIIETSRGLVYIRNRAALIVAAQGSYSETEVEYLRALGGSVLARSVCPEPMGAL
jgi:CRP-like cAMP-binding protein